MFSVSGPSYSLCSLKGSDNSLVCRATGLRRHGRPHNRASSSLLSLPHHRKSLYVFHGRYLRTILCCAVQPLRDVDHSSRKAAQGLERDTSVVNLDEWQCVPDIWGTAARKFGDRIALTDPHHFPFTTMTYSQLRQAILEFAEGLRVLGILPNERVSLFADNSCRWLVADQGIMALGAIDAVRGTKSSFEELTHIYLHSDSVALVVENYDLFVKLLPHLQGVAKVKFVIILWGDKPSPIQRSEGFDVDLYTYSEVIAKGQESRKLVANTAAIHCEHIKLNDVATLVYTSGTTGNPKGVMLTHANLLHQIWHLGAVIDLKPGDRFLSLLPPWHMYERSSEYFSLAKGIEQVYTNVKSLKEDLKKYSPDYFVSVPLVYETLYSGVQKQLLSASKMRKFIAITLISASMMYKDWKRVYEGRVLAQAKIKPSAIFSACEWVVARIMSLILLPIHMLAKILVYKKIYTALGIKKIGISGGGSLPSHVDKFFEAIDITILNGYGLTETSPVVSARRPSNNVLGSVGISLPETEIKVVDPDSGEEVLPGVRGLVKVRGPQIMKGYYKDLEATTEVVDMGGWFDTGDLGWIAPYWETGSARSCGGVIVLDGRAKDTIVLSNGENVDPTHIEEAAMQSRYIQQIMLVGQDQRRLGALIVPNYEELQLESIPLPKTEAFIRQELKKYTSKCAASVGPIYLLAEPFTIESGFLTPTMKMRRNTIAEKYKSEIDNMFKQHT